MIIKKDGRNEDVYFSDETEIKKIEEAILKAEKLIQINELNRYMELANLLEGIYSFGLKVEGVTQLVDYAIEKTKFDLFYVNKKYLSGCRLFTREEALEHWGDKVHGDHEEYLEYELRRAQVFYEVIKNHSPL